MRASTRGRQKADEMVKLSENLSVGDWDFQMDELKAVLWAALTAFLSEHR